MEIMPPVHPGKVLREEYLKPLGITCYRLAAELGVSRATVGDICLERSSISPRMAAMLGKFFNTETRFWLNLQVHYDTRIAAEDPSIIQALAAIKPWSDQVNLDENEIVHIVKGRGRSVRTPPRTKLNPRG